MIKARSPKSESGEWYQDTTRETAPETAPRGPVSVRQAVIQTCQSIALDPSAPAAARVQAARTLAEMAGLLGKIQSAALDTGETREAEMSPEDIDREILRLSGTSSRAK